MKSARTVAGGFRPGIARFVALASAAAMLAASPAGACVAPSALVILDASYSMRNMVARTGQTRFAIARAAVTAFVDRYPGDGHIALRFIGAVAVPTYDGCTDSALVVPFAPAQFNREPFQLALTRARPNGLTPIDLALTEAGKDFMGREPGKLIILITDGLDTCGGSPCSTAEALARQGFTIHTIGFLADRNARRDLQCVAQATGGQYFDVPVALQLTQTLRGLLSDCPIAALPSRPVTPLGPRTA
jgi:Ca-activated chloride channel family protein